ncbi:MAG: phytanoyl-CoA dioxygenase family protein [Pseudomonadaceae bacterium]|nr:phytanoyl-CoA dioxygenase family protein [Pseudomonadaceae bacterium]
MPEIAALSDASSTHQIMTVLDADGVVTLTDFLSPELLQALNAELDPYVASYKQAHISDGYDEFLGHETVRLHGITAKSAAFPALLTEPRILGVMDTLLLPNCADYRLSAAELIEIHGNETAQPLHVDDGSWPRAAWDASPLVVNVMIALTDFTSENGATVVAPGSHRWPQSRQAAAEDLCQAVMPAGSAAIFRGDVVHGGGANVDGTARRGLSISYCLGWLVPVENSVLATPPELARTLSRRAQQLLGYDIYDGSARGTGVLNMLDVGNPASVLDDQ